MIIFPYSLLDIYILCAYTHNLTVTFYWHFCAGISSRRSSPVNFEGSPVSGGGMEGSLISVQYYPNLSSTAPNGPGSESPKYVSSF